MKDEEEIVRLLRRSYGGIEKAQPRSLRLSFRRPHAVESKTTIGINKLDAVGVVKSTQIRTKGPMCPSLWSTCSCQNRLGDGREGEIR